MADFYEPKPNVPIDPEHDKPVVDNPPPVNTAASNPVRPDGTTLIPSNLDGIKQDTLKTVIKENKSA